MKELTIENKDPSLKLHKIRFRSLCIYLLKQPIFQAHASNGWFINILFLPYEEMLEKNLQIHHHDWVTDVITLTYHDEEIFANDKIICGDIILCPVLACEIAYKYSSTPAEELARYVIHGLLHLCGYRDSNRQDKFVMRKLERYLLREISCVYRLQEIFVFLHNYEHKKTIY